MVKESGSARFFIQIDPDHPHTNIAQWVQFDLTNEFLFRVRDLHRLLDLHRLELVTSEFEVAWCLTDGWELRCPYRKQDTWLEIWSCGFTIRSHIVKAGESKVPKAQIYSIEVSSGWVSIDEFFCDHYQTDSLNDYDCLDTVQGLYGSDPSDPDMEVTFALQIISHLSETGAHPLNMNESLRSRMADENFDN